MSVTMSDLGVDFPAEWVEAVNERLNDLHHEDLCMCPEWPASCESGYKPGQWDQPTTVMIAVAVLEPLIRDRLAAQDATISTSQAAEILGVARSTVVRFLEAGRIPYTQPGTRRRVRLADVLAFQRMSTHGTETAQAAK